MQHVYVYKLYVLTYTHMIAMCYKNDFFILRIDHEFIFHIDKSVSTTYLIVKRARICFQSKKESYVQETSHVDEKLMFNYENKGDYAVFLHTIIPFKGVV